MSNSFVKFVDLSLLPAVLLIAGKFLGIFLSINILGIDYKFSEYTNNIFTLGPEIPESEVIKVASYSDIFMYAVIASYFSFILIKAIYFHNSHVKPTLVSRLANKNLLRLVQSSYEIYHAAVIALSFLWMTTLIILLNTILGNTYVWVSVLSLLTSTFLTVALLQDVYKEIENIKSKPGQYDWN